MAGMEGAIFLLNRKIEADTVMARLFGDKEVKVYPGYADEPYGDARSYPYIRYQFIPVPQRALPWVRKDWCQYFVGDNDLSNVINMTERLIWLLNLSEIETLDLPVKDPDGKYKIMDILVHTGTMANVPSQDLGVWEQGVSFTMRYTILNPGWGTKESKVYNLDVLLD